MSAARRSTARVPSVSFEFFPPKSDAQVATLNDTVERLGQYRPDFFSITYGAGGTTQERTCGTVRQIMDGGFRVAAHLTCAGASRDSVIETIDWFRGIGLERFVALRGDPPGGLSEPYVAHPEGFQDTAELVAAMKRAGAAEVSVAAYPERHPQSPDWQTEIDVLKRKVDAGADRAITQFFYENDLFEAYVERVSAAGLSIPVVPGIMPIHRFSSVCNFASRCGASIPERLAHRFEGLDERSETHALVAAAVAAEQMADLMERGVDTFHIYTLNRAELPEAACRMCGIWSEGTSAACAA